MNDPDDKVKFHNADTGETLVHWVRPDGVRDLKFGETNTRLVGHAVLDPNGTPRYLRDTDGRVIADDRL